jgi:hypothetical protein
MKALLICGPWGSGTTAVAGLAVRMGAVGFDPAYHFHTDDARTPDSYELIPFRNIVLQHVDEPTLSRKPSAPGAAQSSLGILQHRIAMQHYGFLPTDRLPWIVLKYPPSILLTPEIFEIFDTRLIHVMRPPEQIEQTRARRNWPAYFGAAGATIIYRHMAEIQNSKKYPTLTIDYAELLAEPMEHASRLAQFVSLEPTPAQLRQAADFVTPPGGGQ